MASGSQTCGFGNLGAATNCSVSKFHQVSPVARPQKQFIHSHQQPNEVWGGLPFRGPSNWAVVRLQVFGAHHIIRDNEVIQKRTTSTGYTLVFWGINGARMVGCWGCFMDLYGMFFFSMWPWTACDQLCFSHVVKLMALSWDTSFQSAGETDKKRHGRRSFFDEKSAAGSIYLGKINHDLTATEPWNHG